jgi:NADPH-dependent 2,4-dienoyl-CoA reductase/sulfur reductase-like enzyme/peroxiredoxin family protein/rhodanese-related sulfurtransferase/TusA-related sulfurtransferase
MKVVIIGGVAGGASAAARLRRLDEKAEIVIFEKTEHISYANCGLPYYIGGVITEQEDILIQTPGSFNARFNVSVHVRQEVTSIDRAKKEVAVKDLSNGTEYREKYDKLILSPGAEPLKPPVKGIENKRVFTLRNVADSETIKRFISASKPKRVIVVGAGYIGLEMAENLHNLGIFVTVVEMAPQVIAPLDIEMAAMVHQHLKTKNVEFYLSEQVVEFREKDGSVTAVLKSGAELPADFVIMSVGVKPESALAVKAGLKTGKTGGVTVNEYLQSSDEDIYAVGDVIEFPDPVFNEPRLVPLAGPANRQGRIAADNIINGNKVRFEGTVGTAIAKVFDISVAVTGFSERILKLKNADYYSTVTHSSSNAGYYPGAKPLTIKLNYGKKDGRVLGAQIVGYAGVDKACEVLSLACQKGLTIYDLKNMDQAYAPPYSSAKSPVNIAGLVAENVLTGKVRMVSWKDVKEAGDKAFILDVREPEETNLGVVPGSFLIPLHSLRKRLNEVPKNKKIYVYCAAGLRAYIAARILMQNGYEEVYDVTGGYKTSQLVFDKQSNEDIYGKYCIEKGDDILSTRPCPPDHDGSDSRLAATGEIIEVNARGLQCPGPIMRLNEKMKALKTGFRIKIYASDPGFANDVKSWCSVTGNRLIDLSVKGGEITAVIQKGEVMAQLSPAQAASTNKTMVVFDDNFDKALAAFVIANGALSMGRKVTMFFTFWGLNILKKKTHPPVSKDIISKMFSIMLPGGTSQLALSKLNMFGMGPLLMRHIMKKKNIESLESLMQTAIKSGVEIIACQMSMDVMGIKREELIDGIRVGGVATYIEASESATMNLFI